MGQIGSNYDNSHSINYIGMTIIKKDGYKKYCNKYSMSYIYIHTTLSYSA